MKVVNALGRRKSAVARVYVVPGKGNIVINGRELNEYFKEDTLRYIVNQPFEVTGTAAQFDVKANLDGGGIKGQADAASLLCDHEINREFVDALWNSKNEPYEDGYFDAYYDGLLRLFAFMHLSGNYRVIFPE